MDRDGRLRKQLYYFCLDLIADPMGVTKQYVHITKNDMKLDKSIFPRETRLEKMKRSNLDMFHD
jgi:hypothetical protein